MPRRETRRLGGRGAARLAHELVEHRLGLELGERGPHAAPYPAAEGDPRARRRTLPRKRSTRQAFGSG